MPTQKTEGTELSVAFGLLDVDPTEVAPNDIGKLFENTLEQSKYNDYLEYYRTNSAHAQQFHSVGLHLRSSYREFGKVASVRWEGPRKQSSRTSMAIDISAAGIPISVKDGSNVVYNRSPHRLFIALPTGTRPLSRAPDWYYTTAPDDFQELYCHVQESWYPEYPADVLEYGKSVKGPERKEVAKFLETLDGKEASAFRERYVRLCHRVAERSAEIFNQGMRESMAGPGRTALVQDVIKDLFRVGDTRYLLCGLDRNADFAVIVPALTDWQSTWAMKNLVATPNLAREQSVVDLELVLERKKQPTRSEVTLGFHVEIRWSHGKLNGKPEAKLYKEFLWSDVPFFDRAYEPTRVQKERCIGTGGYGTVYSGIDKATGKKVAIKEFDVHRFILEDSEREEELQRFKREVRLQSELHHPNIVPVLDRDLDARHPWFSMPLANDSLTDIIEELQDDYDRIDHIFWQILQGLRFAHLNNVIHRDLKPDNVLIFDEDLVQICDFGLGKRRDPSMDTIVLTQTGNNSLGSLAYAAPEQLESFRDADHRADIYAAGRTLLHMVTGRTPALTGSFVCGKYSDIVTRCTKHSPVERYQLIDQLIEEFRTVSSLNVP